MPTHQQFYLEGLRLSELLQGYEGFVLIEAGAMNVTHAVREAASTWLQAYRHEIIRRCNETSLGGSE